MNERNKTEPKVKKLEKKEQNDLLAKCKLV